MNTSESQSNKSNVVVVIIITVAIITLIVLLIVLVKIYQYDDEFTKMDEKFTKIEDDMTKKYAVLELLIASNAMNIDDTATGDNAENTFLSYYNQYNEETDADYSNIEAFISSTSADLS